MGIGDQVVAGSGVRAAVAAYPSKEGRGRGGEGGRSGGRGGGGGVVGLWRTLVQAYEDPRDRD